MKVKPWWCSVWGISGILLPLALVLSGCGGGGGGGATPSIPTTLPPTNLVYSTPSPVYTKGVGIAANIPSNSGGMVTSYAVSPPLPAGLSLNTTTGIISGTPTALSQAVSHLVTASNSGGAATANISITVNDAAPTALTYSMSTAIYTKGVGIAANIPSNSGGMVTSYAVSPPLPAGLSLNTTTGIISGTPTALSQAVSHLVTASNSGGAATANISITVNDVAPTALTYSLPTAIYTKGVGVAANIPSNSGGIVTSYAVSPPLPAGLSLNTTTGIISGTPTVLSIPSNFIVIASNTGGSTAAVVVIEVMDAPPRLIYTDPVAGSFLLKRNIALSSATHLVLDLVGPVGGTGSGIVAFVAVDTTRVIWANVASADPTNSFVQNGNALDLGALPQILKGRVVGPVLQVVAAQKVIGTSVSMSAPLVRIAMDLKVPSTPGPVALSADPLKCQIIDGDGNIAAITVSVGSLIAQ